MELKFVKMQECGNDYIYIDCINHYKSENVNISEDKFEEIAKTLTDRHFSVGGDGVVYICKSDVAVAKMRLFNHDGSEGKMGGVAIGCVAKYLYKQKMFDGKIVSIETLSGVKKVKIYDEHDGAVTAKVNMEQATPLTSATCTLQENNENYTINHPITVLGKNYYITTVSMGNPHCIVFCDDVDMVDVGHIGKAFENNVVFPERVNTEFVQIIDNCTIKVRVWERGNGETLACGTGACAAAVAAVLNGFCEKDLQITVKLLGGELKIKYNDDAVFMTGITKTVFSGVITI